MTNLVDNAVRDGGKAGVGVGLTASMVTVPIEDGGPGIAAGVEEDKFEPFVHGDTARPSP